MGSEARSVEVVVLGTAGSTPACVVVAAVVEEAVVVVDCAAGVTTVPPPLLTPVLAAVITEAFPVELAPLEIPCAVAEAAAGLTAKAAEVKLAAAAVTKLALLLDPAAVPITAP